MSDRTARRREKLARAWHSLDADSFLVSSEPNVRYLTGFTGDSSFLVQTRDRAVIVSDGRYTTQLHEECPDLTIHIRPTNQAMLPGLIDVLKGLGVRRLAFEAQQVSLAMYEALSEGLPGMALKAATGLVERLRAIKDASEIAAIRLAIEHAERAFTIVRAGLRLDATEKDVADEIEATLRRCGAQGSSFPPIVAVGPHAALPHYRPGSRTRIQDSDFVLIDWGADSGLYKSDLTRVLVTGKFSLKFENVYRSVLAAQEQAIAAIRPGVTTGAVDAAARRVLESNQLERYFTHGLGHGVGLEIHEAPRLREGDEGVLRPGMVVTVEPGVYLPGWGGIRIEDDVLVRPDGCEVLTRVPKSLDSIRPY